MFPVTVRSTKSKLDNPNYITGYEITGSNSRPYTVYFGRGFKGERLRLAPGTQLSMGIEQGKWIVSMEIVSGAPAEEPVEAKPPAPDQVPEDVKAVVAKFPGMAVVACDPVPSKPDFVPVQSGAPEDVQRRKIVASMLAVFFPNMDAPTKAQFLKAADEAAQATH